MSLLLRKVKGLITIRELSDLLGWSYETTYRAIRRGILPEPTEVCGMRKFYTPAQVEALVKEFKEGIK